MLWKLIAHTLWTSFDFQFLLLLLLMFGSRYTSCYMLLALAILDIVFH